MHDWGWNHSDLRCVEMLKGDVDLSSLLACLDISISHLRVFAGCGSQHGDRAARSRSVDIWAIRNQWSACIFKCKMKSALSRGRSGIERLKLGDVPVGRGSCSQAGKNCRSESKSLHFERCLEFCKCVLWIVVRLLKWRIWQEGYSLYLYARQFLSTTVFEQSPSKSSNEHVPAIGKFGTRPKVIRALSIMRMAASWDLQVDTKSHGKIGEGCT